MAHIRNRADRFVKDLLGRPKRESSKQKSEGQEVLESLRQRLNRLKKIRRNI